MSATGLADRFGAPIFRLTCCGWNVNGSCFAGCLFPSAGCCVHMRVSVHCFCLLQGTSPGRCRCWVRRWTGSTPGPPALRLVWGELTTAGRTAGHGQGGWQSKDATARTACTGCSFQSRGKQLTHPVICPTARATPASKSVVALWCKHC